MLIHYYGYLMSDAILVIIFSVVIFMSLICVSAVNTRETRARLIAKKIEELKRKTTDLEEISIALESLTGNAQMAMEITKEGKETLEHIIQLDPKNQSFQLHLNNTTERLDALSNNTTTHPLNRQFSNDAAMAKAQYCLNEGARIIQRRTTSDLIETDRQEKFINDMIWARMMISIASFVGQGYEAYDKNNQSKAVAYYKKALDIAHKTTTPDEKKPELIQELEELTQNKRTTLSEHLMPEGQTPNNQSP